MTGPEKVGWRSVISWSCSSSYRGLPACCRVAILLRVAMLAAAATPTLQPWVGPVGVCGGFTWRGGVSELRGQSARRDWNNQQKLIQNINVYRCVFAYTGEYWRIQVLLVCLLAHATVCT